MGLAIGCAHKGRFANPLRKTPCDVAEAVWRAASRKTQLPCLLADAIRRCCVASEIAGVRAIIAHAIDEGAMGFYQHHGSVPSPLGERVMLLPIETAKAVLVD